MRFDVGLWDMLFGKKMVAELPGPGGSDDARRLRVSVKWFERMRREGKIAGAENAVFVYVTDPKGDYSTTLTVGKELNQEQVDALMDPATQALYAVTADSEGKPRTVFVPKKMWDRVRRGHPPKQARPARPRPGRGEDQA